MTTANQPLPILPAPELADHELAPLLSEPFAAAWVPDTPAPATIRDRLGSRLRSTLAAEAGMVTVRRRRATREALGPGVTRQWLYRAADGSERPGEPRQAFLLELAPGASWPAAPADGLQREWLLLAGALTLEGEPLALRDFHWRPAGLAQPALASRDGALVFVRESALPVRPGEGALTVRDAEAGWPEFAPGIRRRVLWQRDGQAALLYHAEPGAAVPNHVHGHDEECLMVQGELFLDDLLLQPGDYQLAPAGTGHRITQTDTGVVIYAHGDAELRFVGQ